MADNEDEILSKLLADNPDLEHLDGEVLHEGLLSEFLQAMVNHVRAAEKFYEMAADEDGFDTPVHLLLANVHVHCELARAHAAAFSAIRPHPEPPTIIVAPRGLDLEVSDD